MRESQRSGPALRTPDRLCARKALLIGKSSLRVSHLTHIHQTFPVSRDCFVYIAGMCWYVEWEGAKWPCMSVAFDCIWNVYGNLLMRCENAGTHPFRLLCVLGLGLARNDHLGGFRIDGLMTNGSFSLSPSLIPKTFPRAVCTVLYVSSDFISTLEYVYSGKAATGEPNTLYHLGLMPDIQLTKCGISEDAIRQRLQHSSTRA